MTRASKWALLAFLIHAAIAAVLITVGIDSTMNVGVAARRGLAGLEFAVDPAVRWSLEVLAPAFKKTVVKFDTPISSVIKGYAYLAYIVAGGLFYGALAGLAGWLVERGSKRRSK
jgi:hypothetical protein